MQLQKNVGQLDRYARIGIGGLLVLLAFMGTIGLWGFIGLIPLATGIMGSCPAYTLAGINTCTMDQKPAA